MLDLKKFIIAAAQKGISVGVGLGGINKLMFEFSRGCFSVKSFLNIWDLPVGNWQFEDKMFEILKNAVTELDRVESLYIENGKPPFEKENRYEGQIHRNLPG